RSPCGRCRTTDLALRMAIWAWRRRSQSRGWRNRSFRAATRKRSASGLPWLTIKHELALPQGLKELLHVGSQGIPGDARIHLLKGVQQAVQLAALGLLGAGQSLPDGDADFVQPEVGLRTGAEEDATFVHLLENDRRALRRNICAQESARQGESKRAPSGHDKGGGGQATTPFITSNDQDVVGVSCRMNSRTSSAAQSTLSAQPPPRVTSRNDPKRVNE